MRPALGGAVLLFMFLETALGATCWGVAGALSGFYFWVTAAALMPLAYFEAQAIAHLVLANAMRGKWDFEPWFTDEVRPKTEAHFISWMYPGFPGALTRWYSWGWFQMLVVGLLLWSRALTLRITELNWRDVSSCTHDSTDLGSPFNANGFFPSGRWVRYSTQEEHAFCDLGLRWADAAAGADYRVIESFELNPGRTSPNYDAPDPDGYPGMRPQDYPDNSVGIANTHPGVQRFTTEKTSSIRANCPATTSAYAPNGQKGAGRYVCTTCLTYKIKTNQYVSPELDYCASYNAARPTSVLCGLCPMGDEPTDPASLTVYAVLYGIWTFFFPFRNIVISAVASTMSDPASPWWIEPQGEEGELLPAEEEEEKKD